MAKKAVAIFSSAKKVVSVGAYEGQLFIVDTHQRFKMSNGDRTACVVVFNRDHDDAKRAVSWLVQGLQEKTVDSEEQLQSFSILV